MPLETTDGLRLRIARRRHVELDAVFFDHRDDFGVFLGPHAVPQAHGAHRDRLADAFGPGGFPGMNRDVEPERPRDAKRVFVQDRGMACLVAGEVESDDAVAHVSAGDLRERHVLCGRHVPQRRDDHATFESEGFAAGRPAAEHRPNHVRERQTVLHVQPGPVSYLGISDVVFL